jgi:hypothetical protein
MGKIITTHVTINAPVDAVWQALTHLDGYRRWNPFITAASGVLAVGQRLQLTITPPGSRSMTFRPWVTAVDDHRYIEWLGRLGMPGIFDGRHSFTLTPTASGRTLLQQSETFSGALIPFSGATLGRTEAGFEEMNEALAHEARRLSTQLHGPAS